MSRVTIVVSLVAFLLALASASSHASPKTNLCTILGMFADEVVAWRDQGIPPSQLVKMAEENTTDASLLAFQRWMILFVYDMSALDAAWIRQRVETKCLQHTFR